MAVLAISHAVKAKRQRTTYFLIGCIVTPVAWAVAQKIMVWPYGGETRLLMFLPFASGLFCVVNAKRYKNYLGWIVVFSRYALAQIVKIFTR